jgi:hypothetical protein
LGQCQQSFSNYQLAWLIQEEYKCQEDSLYQQIGYLIVCLRNNVTCIATCWYWMVQRGKYTGSTVDFGSKFTVLRNLFPLK